MNIRPNILTGYSVCPHDCPSACAVEVEVLDARTIGRVRGAKDQTYTAGVVCEKVARYAFRERGGPQRVAEGGAAAATAGNGQSAAAGTDELIELMRRVDALERAVYQPVATGETPPADGDGAESEGTAVR